MRSKHLDIFARLTARLPCLLRVGRIPENRKTVKVGAIGATKSRDLLEPTPIDRLPAPCKD